MKELESSLWYKTNIEEADRALWNVISQKTNMKSKYTHRLFSVFCDA